MLLFTHAKWSTNWGWVTHTHICVSKLTVIGSPDHRQAIHYLKQRWNIVNWTRRNRFHWNVKWNELIFIQENAFENVVWKMAAILSRPQCVNPIQINEYMYPLAWCHNCHRWCITRSIRIRDHVFHSNAHCLPKQCIFSCYCLEHTRAHHILLTYDIIENAEM